MRNLGPAVRSWLVALLLIPAMLLALSACGQRDSGPKVLAGKDRKSTRLNSSHIQKSRMPSSA